jgi:hypothetical protein
MMRSAFGRLAGSVAQQLRQQAADNDDSGKVSATDAHGDGGGGQALYDTLCC